MTRTTLPTIQSVQTIHKAQALLESGILSTEQKQKLTPLTDAVLSFTGYYLRFANPKCRSEQLDALNKLTTLVTQLEKK